MLISVAAPLAIKNVSRHENRIPPEINFSIINTSPQNKQIIGALVRPDSVKVYILMWPTGLYALETGVDLTTSLTHPGRYFTIN